MLGIVKIMKSNKVAIEKTSSGFLLFSPLYTLSQQSATALGQKDGSPKEERKKTSRRKRTRALPKPSTKNPT
jgi:hypothetical protein